MPTPDIGCTMTASNEPLILPRLFLRSCRRAGSRLKVADSMGTEMSGRSLLLRTLILRRLLARNVLSNDEKYVGLLLPPSAGAVVANAATTLLQRIAVNLNYTVSPAVMESCIRQCGIRHVLTSRKFMEKMPLKVPAELVYLDDFKAQVTLADKLAAAFQSRAMPLGMLEKRLGLLDVRPDDVLTVIFTSGSTGEPKGVMLTYENVGSNIRGVDEVFRITAEDVAVGILPFFHSFGYTASMWLVLALDAAGAYHFSPLEAQQVGKLIGKYKGTVFFGAPTFLRGYVRRCDPADMKTLDVVVAGAEKLPGDLSDAFEKRFGVRPIEGYGCTELSPVVSVNIPASRSPTGDATGVREGTVGRPLPGVQAKVVDPETREPLPQGKAGMLLIRGPNVMKGYLNKPDLTAEVIRDGWYTTGDLAVLHDDGFIEITGRESRFSKIGGEMVPHIRIEETLSRVIGAGEDELKVAVTAIPDERKGERLIVLHTKLHKSPEQICRELAASGLPNIWIPSPDSFVEVEQIPVLGTGKFDLKGIKEKAMQRFALPVDV
jgi:acyl-[acyl-carrier-protein]-phospholipid O-acyltransferase/long-chain-fatty-acid--[acyl-carrier-protein] ligase